MWQQIKDAIKMAYAPIPAKPAPSRRVESWAIFWAIVLVTLLCLPFIVESIRDVIHPIELK